MSVDCGRPNPVCVCVWGASSPPSLSPSHEVCTPQPDPQVSVEMSLLAVGDLVGHENLAYASRNNQGVIVFLTEDHFAVELIASCLMVGRGGIQAALWEISQWVLHRLAQL